MQHYSQFAAVSLLTFRCALILCPNDKSLRMSPFIETVPSDFFPLLF